MNKNRFSLISISIILLILITLTSCFKGTPAQQGTAETEPATAPVATVQPAPPAIVPAPAPEPAPAVEPEVVPEVVIVVEPEPIAEPEAVITEDIPAIEEKPVPETVPETEPVVDVIIIPEPETVPEPETIPEPETVPEPEVVKIEVTPVDEPVVEPEVITIEEEPVIEPVVEIETIPETVPEETSVPEVEPPVEPEAVIAEEEPAVEPEPELVIVEKEPEVEPPAEEPEEERVYARNLTVSVDNFGFENHGIYRYNADFSFSNLDMGITVSKNLLSAHGNVFVSLPADSFILGVKGSYAVTDEERTGCASAYGTLPLFRTEDSLFSADLEATYKSDSNSDLTLAKGGFGMKSESGISRVAAAFSVTKAFPIYDSASDYTLFEGNYTIKLGGNSIIYFEGKGRFQLVTDPAKLPASEELKAGGAATVRGYKENAAQGKNGALANAELHVGIIPQVLDVFGFADYGYTGADHLAGIGLGAKLTLLRFLDLNVTAGFPRIVLPGMDSGDTDKARINFSLSLTPRF